MDYNILLWDIENIPIKYLNQIENKMVKKPYFKYVVSKSKITQPQRIKLEKHGYICIQTQKIADKSIFDLFEFHFEKANQIILISTDSDFVPMSKKCETHRKKLQWIVHESNNFNILMRNRLTDEKVTITALTNINSKKKKKKSVQNPSTKEEEDFGNLGFANLKDLVNLSNQSKKTKSSSNLENSIDLTDFKKEMNKATMRDRINFIKNIITTRIKYLIEKREIATCECCGTTELMSNKDENVFLCLDCETKFVVDYRQRKELTHKEKIAAFLKDTEESIKKSGIIEFTQEDYEFNLIEYELSKLKVPEKYKIENLKEE